MTDVYLNSISSPCLRSPILPSVATLVNPLSTLYTIILRILRTILLVLLSHLPGSLQAIKRISVANTGILFHDGRALATCESGPPMRVALPGLETVGWYNGKKADGEKDGEHGSGFGGNGLLSFMKERTTAHPRIDPETGELNYFTQHSPHRMYITRLYQQKSLLPSHNAIGNTHKTPECPCSRHYLCKDDARFWCLLWLYSNHGSTSLTRSAKPCEE